MNDVELMLYEQMENIPSQYIDGIDFKYVTSRNTNKLPRQFAEEVYDSIME